MCLVLHVDFDRHYVWRTCQLYASLVSAEHLDWRRPQESAQRKLLQKRRRPGQMEYRLRRLVQTDPNLAGDFRDRTPQIF